MVTTVFSFSDPVFSAPDESTIDATVVFTQGGDSHPFTAAKDDPLTADVYAAMLASGHVAPYAAPILSPAQAAAARLAAGLEVTSESTPGTSGTFGVGPEDISNIQAQMISIMDGQIFTNGQTTRDWIDQAGNPHPFTIPQFRAFARAAAVFVDGCKTVQMLNSGDPPANHATIP